MKSRLIQICDIENIDITDEAINSIIKISNGDLRAAINTLQHIQSASTSRIESDDIYHISGHCTPDIIQNIYKNLVKISRNRVSLNECIAIIIDIVVDNNITIFNLLNGLKDIIMASKLSTNQKIYLIHNLSRQEIYDSVNVNPKIILMSLASVFVLVKDVKS
jgi:DNA polymerase III delta prime subunit